MSFQVRYEVLGNMDNFGRTMKKVEKNLVGLEKLNKNITKAMKAAWVGVALAGVDMLWDGIVKVTKAAAEEAKSQALLAQAMDKSWKSTKELNKANEEFITKLAYASGIADDKLRPAYSKIVRVTKDATKAQKYFTLALDVAAGTGKDVNVVSQAMAKYLGGNKKALDKIVPGLQNAGDKMKFLAQYTGAAKTAGENMPFERLSLVFEDIQERLGSYILPYLQQFADWATGPEAQAIIDDLFVGIEDFFNWLKSGEAKAAIDQIAEAFGYLYDTLMEIKKFMDDNKWIFDILGSGYNILKFLSDTKDKGAKLRNTGGTEILAQSGSQLANRFSSAPARPLSITVNGSFSDSGKFIVKSLKQEASKKGVTVGRMIQ